MLKIGSKITQLRKAKNRLQADLVKAVITSRDIIGKCERNDNLSSIEMAIKPIEVFDVSVDFLLGRRKRAAYDKETIRKLQEMENLDQETKKDDLHHH